MSESAVQDSTFEQAPAGAPPTEAGAGSEHRPGVDAGRLQEHRQDARAKDRKSAAVAAAVVAILIVMAADTVVLVQPAFATVILCASLAGGYSGRDGAALPVGA